MIKYRWGGVGWDNNVHVPVYTHDDDDDDDDPHDHDHDFHGCTSEGNSGCTSELKSGCTSEWSPPMLWPQICGTNPKLK